MIFSVLLHLATHKLHSITRMELPQRHLPSRILVSSKSMKVTFKTEYAGLILMVMGEPITVLSTTVVTLWFGGTLVKVKLFLPNMKISNGLTSRH